MDDCINHALARVVRMAKLLDGDAQTEEDLRGQLELCSALRERGLHEFALALNELEEVLRERLSSSAPDDVDSALDVDVWGDVLDLV